MADLLLDHQQQLLPYLGNQKAIELLVDVREINLHQVLPEPVRQRLHLHELNLKEYVRYQCSYDLIAKLRVVITLKLF